MILGRNAGLWVALIQAALNVAVVVAGIPLDAEQVAALNGLGLIVIAIVANEADPTTLATFARSISPPASPLATTSSGTAGSPTGPTDQSAGGGTADSSGPSAGGGASG